MTRPDTAVLLLRKLLHYLVVAHRIKRINMGFLPRERPRKQGLQIAAVRRPLYL